MTDLFFAETVGFLNYDNTKPIEKAQKIVSKMSIDEKIGQILMLTFRQWKNDAFSENMQNVTALNDTLRTIISDYHLGGLVLFAENCTDTEQLVRLTCVLFFWHSCWVSPNRTTARCV